MTIASATRHPWFLLFATCLLGIAIARPWTIRPIAPSVEVEAGTTGTTAARNTSTSPLSSSSSGAFDPSRYVSSIWDSRIVPAASSSSTDLVGALRDARAGNAPARAMLVAGTGVVIDVDTRSRVGLAHVDLAPGDGQPDAALQIGPVLRGTVLRDAVGFIRFEDFANQIDHARVAGALNSRVLETVLRDVGTPEALRGRTIEFRGAALIGGGNAAPEIVPIALQVHPATTRPYPSPQAGPPTRGLGALGWRPSPRKTPPQRAQTARRGPRRGEGADTLAPEGGEGRVRGLTGRGYFFGARMPMITRLGGRIGESPRGVAP